MSSRLMASGWSPSAPARAPRRSTRTCSRTPRSVVLATTFRTASGEARVLDCLTVPRDGPLHPHRQLLRIVEGTRGLVSFELRIVPRFDYGYLEPWLCHENMNLFTAVGGDDALIIGGDVSLTPRGEKS